MEGEIGIYKINPGGSGGTETLDQVLQAGNTSARTIDLTAAGASWLLNYLGLNANDGGGHTVLANYRQYQINDGTTGYADNIDLSALHVIISDNLINSTTMTKLGVVIKNQDGTKVTFTSSQIIVANTVSGQTYNLTWPVALNNQAVTLAARSGTIAPTNYIINAQSGTSYTFVLSDFTDGTIVEGSNAAATTYTVPSNSSVNAFSGASVIVVQKGAGKITFAAGAGVTILSKNGNLSISAQYVAVSLIQSSTTDTWYLVGDLSA